jgi:2,5-diketo-D-gluconate reductase A
MSGEAPVLADATAASVGEVVIRWHLQIGTIVIPKSSSPARIRQNHEVVVVVELTDDDMSAIAALDRGGRNGPDPDIFDFPAAYRGKAHEHG